MSFLTQEGHFVRFVLTAPSKKQVKALLWTLTPRQNLTLREIILNVGEQYPQKYKKLKPLSTHFVRTHWENLLTFLKEHSAYIIQ